MSTSSTSRSTTRPFEPLPYGVCDLDREPLSLLPTATDLPLPRTEAPASVPFQREIDHAVGNRIPEESMLAALVLAGLLLFFGIRSAFRKTRRSPAARQSATRPMRYAARRRSPARAWAVGLMIALLAIVSLVSTAFWLALDHVDEKRRQHDHAGAHELLLRLGDFYPMLSWIHRWDRDPVALMLEANAVEGIGEGLAANRLDSATSLARWDRVVTQQGKEARQAVYLAAASQALGRGDARWALVRTQAAKSAGAGSPEAVEAVQRARWHWMAQSLREGDLEEVKQHSPQLRSSWRPDLQVALAATAAREEALEQVAEGRLTGAIALLESAWQEGQNWPRTAAWMACDLAGLWERRAMTTLDSGQPTTAVSALRSALGYVTDSPVVLRALPYALRDQGLAQIEDGKATAAITSFEEAFEKATAERELKVHLRSDLTGAYLLLGRQRFEKEEFDEAVTAMERAHLYSDGSTETGRALASARLRRADHALEKGHFDDARQDLVQVRRHPELAAEARLRLHWLPDAEKRVRAVRAFGKWVDLPTVRGERPIDSTGDGQADFLVYFGPSGNVASRDLSRPRAEVAFTRPGSPNEVNLLLRDLTGNGSFDEVTTYQDDARSQALVDASGDGRPDYNLHYLEGRLVNREILSARVMLRLGSLAVGVRADVFSRPDPYLVIRHKGKSIFRSKTHVNTHFAYLGEGVVVDFNHGDELLLWLFDEDVFTQDDFLDRLKLKGALPESGRYWMQNRNASIELSIRPSELPVGYKAVFDPPETDYNAFRDNPLLAPEFGELVARARDLEAEGQAMEWVSSMVVSELLVVALLPEAPLLAQIALGIAAEGVVGSAMQ